ncbi:MAG: HAMP domain-containing protein [Archangiaceae bacterium]|nr:HAMP domain-containing protein [Archangiaceae bacterium]
MRLRTTLALAFLALSLVQVSTVVPFALRNLTALLTGQEHQRLDRVMLAVEATAQRRRDDAKSKMDELAQSRELEDVARDADPKHLPPPASLTTAAGGLMVPRGLQVLSLLDGAGGTLSSGHLPAKLGDVDDALFQVTRSKANALTVVMVELADASGLRKAPALVTARAVDYGDSRIWAVGGLLLDDAFASELARLTGAQVEISAEGQTVARTGPKPANAALRHLDFDGLVPAQVQLSFSRAEMLATQDEVLRAFLAFASLGVALALFSGVLVARRITRPLEALTDASRRIAAGELEVKVDVAAQGGEVRTLIDTFNRMTEDLKATTEKLVQSERIAAWQEVARRLAHEIKNPLTPIKMSLETLVALAQRDDPRFTAMFNQSAGAVLEEVERLKRTVDEFSQFARLPRPSLQRLDLSELCTQVLALYAPGKVTYRAELSPRVLADADRDQLTQVLVNLVKNGEEAMASSGGAVTVRTGHDDAQVFLEVEDQGPGVPQGQRARIFEPYVTTKSGGTGLGLAIAARIAQEHGGRLELLDSTAGARFRLTLPRPS